VLGLISMTLALSYAMVRSQMTSVAIQGNHSRRTDARHAAITGMTIALRKMHDADWAGVDSVLTGQLNEHDSYQVTHTTGDASLDEDDPDYAEFPYRVTLVSTGYATDPANPSIQASHQVRTVVQLVRRKFSDEPSNWTQLQQRDADTPYTVYQWADRPVYVNVPVRTEGAMYLQGELKLCDDYPADASRPFHGLIDEVAIFGDALDDVEIADIYNGALGLGGADGYDDVQDAYQSNNPIHWWRLNEQPDTHIADDEAGDNDGEHEGAVSGIEDAPHTGFQRAAQFDGVDDHIDLGTMDVSGGQITILAWFKADHLDRHSDARIISKATGTAVADHYWMVSTCKTGSAQRLRFRLKTNGSTTELQATSGDISAGAWVFAAAVYDGVTMRLYKDGTLVGSTVKTGAIDSDSTVPAWIGDNPPGCPRIRYLQDLEAMRVAGEGDHRPMTGPLFMPFGRTDEATLSLVQDHLNVPAVDVAASNSAPLSHPGTVETYQLYPGGKEYEIPALGYSINDVTLGPHPVDNPLGIYRRNGGVDLNDNVTIKGTVITYGSDPDIHIRGTNVHLEGVNLPSLDGAGEAVQLPAAIVKDDIRVHEYCSGSLTGLSVVSDEFEFKKGNWDVDFDVTGRLLTGKLELRGRWQWNKTDATWLSYLRNFMAQLAGPDPVEFFPQWLFANHDLNPEPLLTIEPPANEVAYHWQNWNNPVYVPHPNDEGLVWDLIEWTDNP